MPATSSALHPPALRAALQRLQPRERLAVGLATAVVLLYLLWALALAPALATLRAAPERHRAADAQLAEMRALASQAQALQGQRGAQPPSRADALRTFDQATQQTLGASTRVTVTGNRVTVAIDAATPEALARWLSQARLNARLLPVESRLSRKGEGTALRLSGTVVLSGPSLSESP